MVVLAKRWRSYPEEIRRLNPNWGLIDEIASQELRKEYVGETDSPAEIVIPYDPPIIKQQKSSAQMRLELARV